MSSSGRAVKKAGKTILTLKSDFKVYSHYKLLDQIFFWHQCAKKKKKNLLLQLKSNKAYKQYHNAAVAGIDDISKEKKNKFAIIWVRKGPAIAELITIIILKTIS